MIVPPCFIGNRIIASAGEGWDVLSLYSIRTGEVLSRERLSFSPGGLAASSLTSFNHDLNGERIFDRVVVAEKSSGNIFSLQNRFSNAT